jgi:polysaccharide export outer membrane protein
MNKNLMSITFPKRFANAAWVLGLALMASLSLLSAGSPNMGLAADSPAGPDYLLGPEDVVLISVWKDEHLTKELVVRPDGMISFPLVGDVQAAGRTVEDVRSDITKRLSRYIPNAQVSVTVTKLLSYRIYVLGRVNKPGEFMVGHITDVLQALSMAGGLTPFASENDIKIIRRVNGEQVVYEFRYGDVRKGRDLTQNILLQRGDVVMVP